MKVEKWRCTFCEKDVTEDQAHNDARCPHCDCTWCGIECCGAYPEWREEEVPNGNDG